MFVHILYIFTIGVSYTGNNGEKNNQPDQLRNYKKLSHCFFRGFFKLDLSKPGVKQDFHLYSVSFFFNFPAFLLAYIYAVNIS